MTGLRVSKGGFSAQIQDLGRTGHLDIGVGESGPMDEFSFRVANKLIGNPAFCSQIEIANGGLVVRSDIDTSIALTGARVEAYLNRSPLPMWQSIPISAGDEIHIGNTQQGVFNYLAIRGGFISPSVLGSSATNQREKLGGIDSEGSLLKPGLLLPARESKQNVSLMLPAHRRPSYASTTLALRLIPSCQWSRFDKHQRKAMLSRRYRISAQSNRMGYRLFSDEHTSVTLPKITSEGMALGSVQVPNEKEVIIMLNDRQTMGGYPKLGSVLPSDCWRLAQAKPGTEVYFRILRLSQAQRTFKSTEESINKLKLHDMS